MKLMLFQRNVSCRLPQDKDTSERQVCVLRPETTASVVRAFIENGVQDMPWKVLL